MWYKTNSRVYVANDHACWIDPKQETKVKKKRFGTVIRSQETGLSAMMKRHFTEVTQFITDRCSISAGESTEDDRMA